MIVLKGERHQNALIRMGTSTTYLLIQVYGTREAIQARGYWVSGPDIPS